MTSSPHTGQGLSMSGTSPSDLSASSISTQAVEQGAKHSPGPWHAVTDDFGIANGEPYVCVYDDRLTGIANIRVNKRFWENGTERELPFEANARLIAAAPDMLAALRQIAGMFSVPKSGIAGLDGNLRVGEIYEVANAAISKALEHRPSTEPSSGLPERE